MDEPALSWPFWKFSLKREDLFTTLHDRYNTFPSSIQDPEAFHHDVYEIATDAATADEFHRLMAERKQRRLRELNDSLESASVEIIANPSLIGTEQWQYALQLFRTKSLDSLVRYFASYLPDSHPWHGAGPSDSASVSTDESLPQSLFHDDARDGGNPILTHEPLSFSTDLHVAPHLPPSPRSMTMQSDSSSSAASPLGDLAHCDYNLLTLTPARTLSFSESESDRFGGLADSHHLHDDEASRSSHPETPTTSVSDLSETRSIGEADDKDHVLSAEVSESSIAFLSTVAVVESMESETPTPKPEAAAVAGAAIPSFFDAKQSPLRRRHRSYSPTRSHAFLEDSQVLEQAQAPAQHRTPRSPQLRRRDANGAFDATRRRSPGDLVSRIHKPIPDDARSRPRRRKRLVEC